MPVKGTAAHTSTGPRPPLADRLTPAQWLALDAVAAVLVALWVVFDLRLRHGFRFELPQAWFGVLGAAVTLPVAVRRRWPIPVLAVVVAAVATLTALGRAELDMDITLGMAIYTVAVTCRRPVAVAALAGTETVLIGGLIAAAATALGPVDTAHSLLTAGALWFVGDSVRERRRYLAACREQEAQRQTDHGRLAVREERVRIARELHDVVAHTLSVVTFQAGVGRKIGATRPAALTAADAHAHDVLVNSSYATAHKLSVGNKLVIGGTGFTITGIASVPQSGNPPDAYIPLAAAQSIGQASSGGRLSGTVNTFYVSAASAADIPAVQAGLSQLLPGATVTDAGNLAGEVTGSLASASSLAASLGRWLSAAVLAAAFGVASVLTMAAVSRRVREFGTLKALGWRSRRVVGQVMGESLVIGVGGAVLGVALGYGGSALINALAPKLTATVGASNAASVAGAGRFLGAGATQALTGAGHSVSVTLSAPVTISVIGLAVLLALAGGLIAGSFGGWRAARLRPAAALARVA
jgi:hypothetical protein